MTDAEYTAILTEIRESLKTTDARCKSNTHRLDEMAGQREDMGELKTNVALLRAEQENLKADIREIKSDVRSLTLKPARRWDGAVEKVIFTVLGVLAAFLLARFGIV